LSKTIRNLSIIHFVDTNIPMYAEGKLIAVTDIEVLQEILHRYTALGQRQRAVEVARLFLQVVPEALPVTKDTFLLAMDLHLNYTGPQARDALHAAVMQQHGIDTMISADRHFDGLPGITRLDPLSWLARKVWSAACPSIPGIRASLALGRVRPASAGCGWSATAPSPARAQHP
jgi:hypothetical protein